MPKFYLTNAIAYMNAGPHVGHALEMVQGDAITRYHRMIGDDTRFLTGADEHGSKIDQTAKEKGMTPQALVDANSQIFIDLQQMFGCANDDFIRTTSDLHKRGAQKLWAKMEEAGVFYEKDYEGLYCTGCETFYQEKDLVDGLCPNHKKAPELLKEKNLFFKLSAYSDAVRDLILSNKLVIKPESRRNEFLSFLKEGLQDVSFSRPKEVLGWGIEVPNHPDQVMYVWCDALSNYLTALGYADDDAMVERYWPADVHLIGKDIIRFHCGIWPAMLMAAGLPTPRAVYVHGFVTSEGQKMSKSLGNVVDPVELIKNYGQDPVRFYLLREIPTGDDGDFSMNRFKVVYEDELQNTIGNLVRRVIAMVIKYQEGKVAAFEGEHAQVAAAWKRYHEGFLGFDVRSSCEAVVELARYANGLIEQSKPWALAKENDPKLALVLSELVHVCRQIGHLLEPIIPATSKAILDQVEGETVQMGEPLFPAKDW